LFQHLIIETKTFSDLFDQEEILTKVYIDTNQIYRLIISMNNQTKIVYLNARGEWFDPSKEG